MLYSSQEKLRIHFDPDKPYVPLKYSISGQKKIILSNPVEYKIEGILESQ
jgi:hypothetical protein